MQGPSGFQAVLEPWIRAGKATINLSDYRIDFFHDKGSVSQIYLRHVQHEKDMYNYQGSEIHLLLSDETTHLTEKIYLFLRTRVRLGSHKIDYPEVQKHLPWVKPGKFPMIFCGSNPGNIGHNFVKRMFIDSAPPNTVWQTPKEQGGLKRVFIPARLEDNKALLAEDPDYADRLLGAGGALAKALLEGSWDIASGGAISDVWDDSVHVVEPFIIPENCFVTRSFDFGTFHPSAVLYTMISNGETVKDYQGNDLYFQPDSQIVIHEIYNWNGNDNEGNRMSAYDVGRQIARYEATLPYRDNIRCGPGDNQIFQNRGGIHQTIHDLLVDGYNDEMATLAKENEGYKWGYDVTKLFIRADQSANSRVQGLNLVRSYLQGALDGESKGLYFFNTCRHCIRTIPTLPRSESNPEDVDTKSEDHLFDIVKYNCLAQRSSFQYLHMSGI